MSLVPDDLALHARKGIQNFDGMLNKSAAIVAAVTCSILKSEGRFNFKTSFLEIGVYKGKFFSLIEHASKGTGMLLVGVDPFSLEHQSQPEVLYNFMQNKMEIERINLVKGLSTEKEKIIKAIGASEIILSHVDGSHKEPDVYGDLEMLDSICATDAIVICDDFWNKSQLGVTTALFRFILSETNNLKPFLLSNTKLYLCREEKSEFYREKFSQAFQLNSEFEILREWSEKRKNSSWWHTEQKISHHNVLLV